MKEGRQYKAIEKEKAGEVARISFFYEYYDDLWMKWFMQNYCCL